MWGEIQTPPQTQARVFEEDDSGVTDDRPGAESGRQTPGCEIQMPAHAGDNLQKQSATNDWPFLSHNVSAMLEAVAGSGIQVKSQQKGEADLTLDQRRDELLQQYRSRPLVFLERYQAHLKPQHLAAFSHLRSDPRAQHYCRVIQRRAPGRTDRTRVRNQRYAALNALHREGQYFNEEQMRMRAPLLYEQYIGQYLTDEEIVERSQKAMQEGAAQGASGGTEGCTAGLAHILLDSYQERLLQSRLEEEQEKEEAAVEEQEDEDEEVDEERQPCAEEKALLRQEFISQMHQRFLDGKDKDFNYSEVDGNSDYDNLDIVSRDAEEKYFDEDDYDEEDDEEVEEEEGEKEKECLQPDGKPEDGVNKEEVEEEECMTE